MYDIINDLEVIVNEIYILTSISCNKLMLSKYTAVLFPFELIWMSPPPSVWNTAEVTNQNQKIYLKFEWLFPTYIQMMFLPERTGNHSFERIT